MTAPHRSDVLFFQDALDDRRSRGRLEVHSREPRLVDAATALHQVSRDVEQILLDALRVVRLDQADAARRMGISASLFSRQLQNVDNQHISVQRLYLLEDAFWRAFLIGVIEQRRLATIEPRTIRGL